MSFSGGTRDSQPYIQRNIYIGEGGRGSPFQKKKGGISWGEKPFFLSLKGEERGG